MEICRFSRQPNADKFMDFVWDVMESLYYGRSVLATPDQTSAVAMQTIQALVDSTLKTQAETTRCMVTMTTTLAALANHFTGAVPAQQPAPQPVTVTPKDYAVHDDPAPSSKNESTLVPAPQKSSVPVAVTPKSASAPVTWRDEVYQTMDKIIRNAPELYSSRRDILNQIYTKMKRDYGFVQEQERINYRKSHVYTSYLSTIQIIESSTTYREIFDSILNDLYNDAIIKHVRKNDSNPNSQLPSVSSGNSASLKPNPVSSNLRPLPFWMNSPFPPLCRMNPQSSPSPPLLSPFWMNVLPPSMPQLLRPLLSTMIPPATSPSLTATSIKI